MPLFIIGVLGLPSSRPRGGGFRKSRQDRGFFQELARHVDPPRGSRGDIDAKGVWKDGMWTLELRRKLDTGHPDDVVFVPGKKHAFGLSVHDNDGDVDHSYSIGSTQLILKK
ncbi:MAG: ethylbenzene dehydrogenase-related protein [bacterium]|nr:ethylbenzene dehydrogenase-related protein [bacterium]